MTDLTRGTQCGLRRMACEGCTVRVTEVDKRPAIKAPIAARHGVAQAPFLLGSWGL